MHVGRLPHRGLPTARRSSATRSSARSSERGSFGRVVDGMSLRFSKAQKAVKFRTSAEERASYDEERKAMRRHSIENQYRVRAPSRLEGYVVKLNIR